MAHYKEYSMQMSCNPDEMFIYEDWKAIEGRSTTVKMVKK
jgi:hypothetical protein